MPDQESLPPGRSDSRENTDDGSERVSVLVEVLSATTPKDEVHELRELFSSLSEAIRFLQDESVELDSDERAEVMQGLSDGMRDIETASLGLLEFKHRLRIAESDLVGEEIHHSLPMVMLVERLNQHIAVAMSAAFSVSSSLLGGTKMGVAVSGPVRNMFLQSVSLVRSTLARLEAVIDDVEEELLARQ